MMESLTGMHRCRTFPRRDGKASFEGYRRFGQSCVHGEPSMALFLSVAAHSLYRNMIFGIRLPSKKAFDIRMLFTILLDETTLQSMACSGDFTNCSCLYLLGTLISKMFMLKAQNE